MKPRDYQKKTLEAFAAADNNGLLASGLGTGKTAVGCWIAQAAGAERILIVGPLRTEEGWRTHVKDILSRELIVISNKRKAEREALALAVSGGDGVFFIGWEYLRSIGTERQEQEDGSKKTVVLARPLGRKPFDLVIADEWHRASNPRSTNRKVISKVKATRRLALSATPAGSTPHNIWSAYNWLWPQEYRYLCPFRDEYFNYEFDPFNYSGVRYTDEKQPGKAKADAPCHVQITQAEANPELPGVVINREYVDLNREQRRIYTEWEEQAVAWLDDNPSAVKLPVELDIRLKQVTLGVPTLEQQADGTQLVTFKKDCKSSKIDRLLDILADLPEGTPVVVWTHAQRFIPAVVHRLTKAGYKAIEVSGKSKGDYRDLITGKAQIIVAQHAAMAEGTDGLQNVCHVEVWLSINPSVVLSEQATGRLNRQGQTQPVIRYLIQARDTLDARALDRLQERYRTLENSELI